MPTAVGQSGVAEEVVTQLRKGLDKLGGVGPWKQSPAVTLGASGSACLEGG